MQIRIRNGKDFYAGLFFFFIGIVTVLEARGYSVGTARNMGAVMNSTWAWTELAMNRSSR